MPITMQLTIPIGFTVDMDKCKHPLFAQFNEALNNMTPDQWADHIIASIQIAFDLANERKDGSTDNWAYLHLIEGSAVHLSNV